MTYKWFVDQVLEQWDKRGWYQYRLSLIHLLENDALRKRALLEEYQQVQHQGTQALAQFKAALSPRDRNRIELQQQHVRPYSRRCMALMDQYHAITNGGIQHVVLRERISQGTLLDELPRSIDERV